MSARDAARDASDDESSDVIEVDVKNSVTHIRVRHNVLGRLCLLFMFAAFTTVLVFIILALSSAVSISDEVHMQLHEWRTTGQLSDVLNASIAFMNEYQIILANSNATVTVVRGLIEDLSLPAVNATQDLAATLQALREHQLTASGAMPIISATLVADGA